MIYKIIREFHLKNTFENGQCFRWNASNGGYIGIAYGKVIHISCNGDKFAFKGITEEDFNSIFSDYFDLSRDYDAVFKDAPNEENLSKAKEYGRGMRLLRQEPWETLISFILSQNNNIVRIKGIIERICVLCGKPLVFEDTIYYAFPTPQELAGLTLAQLQKAGCGYRAEYIADTAKVIADGHFDINTLSLFPYEEAKAKLISLKGVGPKVADCILLFSLGFSQAFPIDTWIKKVMQALYMCRPASEKEMQACACETFGKDAGILQQYLFYYARDHKLKGL